MFGSSSQQLLQIVPTITGCGRAGPHDRLRQRLRRRRGHLPLRGGHRGRHRDRRPRRHRRLVRPAHQRAERQRLPEPRRAAHARAGRGPGHHGRRHQHGLHARHHPHHRHRQRRAARRPGGGRGRQRLGDRHGQPGASAQDRCGHRAGAADHHPQRHRLRAALHAELQRAATARCTDDAGRDHRARGQPAGLQRLPQHRPRDGREPDHRRGDRQPGARGQLRPHRRGVRPGQRPALRHAQQRRHRQRRGRRQPRHRQPGRQHHHRHQRADLGRPGHPARHRAPVARLGQRRPSAHRVPRQRRRLPHRTAPHQPRQPGRSTRTRSQAWPSPPTASSMSPPPRARSSWSMSTATALPCPPPP